MRTVVNPITEKHLALWLSIKDEIRGLLYESKSCSKQSLNSLFAIHTAVFNHYHIRPAYCGNCGAMNTWRMIYNDVKELTEPAKEIVAAVAPKKTRAKRKVKK